MAEKVADSDASASKEPENENNNMAVCEVCKMILSADVTMQQHIMTSQHEKAYNAMRKVAVDKETYGLYVRGYGPKTDKNHILASFAKYGTIIWVHFGYDFLILDYKDEKSMNEALKYPHYLSGKRLLVKRKETRTEKAETDQQNDDDKETINKLRGIDSFEEQYRKLVCELQPDLQGQHITCERVCEDLLRLLRNSYPYCQVFPFGSTLTGLSFKNSDLDIYVSGINSGDEVRQLYRIKRTLVSSQFFTNTIVIANAKIPIMKCVHVRTKLNCDINIRNMLGVCNTKLIRYYLRLTPKIKTVLIILKFWARVHRLTGQNHLFTNYSLILMLLFMLQHPPYHLPTVCSLQSDPRFNNFQDGWNGGFCEIEMFPSRLHTESVAKTLMNFFEFYTKFRYNINVINPYLGVEIMKEAFRTPETLPWAYKMYSQLVMAEKCKPLKIESSICVQDPFEHSRNTTPVITDSTLMAFISLCRSGSKICAEGCNNFLYKIFTVEPENFKPQLLVSSISRECVIPMGLNNTYVYKYANDDCPQEDRKKAVFSLWIEGLNKFTKTVLCDVLSFEVREVDATSHKNMKKEGQTDIHDRPVVQRYRCTTMVSMWNNRRVAGKLPQDLEHASNLEKEIAITKKLLEVYKDIKPTNTLLECEVTLSPRKDPPAVIVKVKKIKSYKKLFKSFVDYFMAHFPNWFQNYEKELCKQMSRES